MEVFYIFGGIIILIAASIYFRDIYID